MPLKSLRKNIGITIKIISIKYLRSIHKKTENYYHKKIKKDEILIIYLGLYDMLETGLTNILNQKIIKKIVNHLS
jgi:hypothetical protein